MRCCECFPGWQRRTQSDNYEVMGRTTQVLLKTERMKKEWGGGGGGGGRGQEGKTCLNIAANLTSNNFLSNQTLTRGSFSFLFRYREASISIQETGSYLPLPYSYKLSHLNGLGGKSSTSSL